MSDFENDILNSSHFLGNCYFYRKCGEISEKDIISIKNDANEIINNMKDVLKTINFIEHLCDISNELPKHPIEEQMTFLYESLLEINKKLPCNVYLPFLEDSTRNYLICHRDVDGSIYYLPEQLNNLHALLFNTENIDILNNILGTFYLDQEKGWTLLNRGQVIGSIHFNLEEFIQGLSGRDCSELKKQKEWLESELLKYEQISNVTKYKESLDEIEGSLLRENPDEELDVQVQLKQIQFNNVKRELSQIDRVLKSNKQFKKFVVAKMHNYLLCLSFNLRTVPNFSEKCS